MRQIDRKSFKKKEVLNMKRLTSYTANFIAFGVLCVTLVGAVVVA
ncbi:MAG: hypothetical protein ACE5EB_08100 [Thermodesulfobacteriota bacterium]